VDDRDDQFDAMVEMLEQAGLVETYVDSDGRGAMRLTAEGERVARQMAMSSEDEQDLLLAALVEAAEEET
jgi:DNA-binding MarR family transcriptional regulator